MIDASDAYRAAITGDARRIFLKAVIDMISPDLAYGTGNSSGESRYSKLEQLHDKIFNVDTKYATLEHNRWLLDGTWDIYPDSPADMVGQIGYVSDSIAGDDGTFAQNPWVELRFSGVSVLQACSVYFPGNSYDGLPQDFKVEVKQGGTAYFSKEFTGNSDPSVSVNGFTVNNPDAIRITVSKWSIPHRRVRIPEILPGIYEIWDEDIIAEFGVKQQGNFSCLTLPYGTCTLKMDNLDRRFEPRSKAGLFQSIEERQAIDISIGTRLQDGTDDYKRIGVYYQYSGGWKTGDNGLTMQWDLVDIIGLLANREFIPPATLPTTLEGWIAALVAQLGENFKNRYTVDSNYAQTEIVANSADDVTGEKCGDVLRWVCMAAGVWPRADAETGYLAAEPFWNQGNKLDLDNLVSYPIMRANDDLAVLIFTIYGNNGNTAKYSISGNSTASSQTVTVDNPFIHTENQAITAARLILSCYGGNQYETTGRGGPTSEIGDVDTIWLDESSATTARRMMQTFNFSDGVLQGCQSTLLQPDGAFMFQNREVITDSGTWTTPSGASKIRVILVGHGANGTDGTDGSWSARGEDGIDGSGAKVWSSTISVNPGQVFRVTIGADTVFGEYTSANGKRYENGYTDIANGDSYARTGVKVPLPGSGDGGIKGTGGRKGNRHKETRQNAAGETYIKTVVDNVPGAGKPGTPGASGCVVVYWDKG